jgi:hypothetical protein
LLSIFTANTIGSTIAWCDGRWDERFDAAFELHHLQQYTPRMHKDKDKSSTMFLRFVVGCTACGIVYARVTSRSEALFVINAYKSPKLIPDVSPFTIGPYVPTSFSFAILPCGAFFGLQKLYGCGRTKTPQKDEPKA